MGEVAQSVREQVMQLLWTAFARHLRSEQIKPLSSGSLGQDVLDGELAPLVVHRLRGVVALLQVSEHEGALSRPTRPVERARAARGARPGSRGRCRRRLTGTLDRRGQCLKAVPDALTEVLRSRITSRSRAEAGNAVVTSCPSSAASQSPRRDSGRDLDCCCRWTLVLPDAQHAPAL